MTPVSRTVVRYGLLILTAAILEHAPSSRNCASTGPWPTPC